MYNKKCCSKYNKNYIIGVQLTKFNNAELYENIENTYDNINFSKPMFNEILINEIQQLDIFIINY